MTALVHRQPGPLPVRQQAHRSPEWLVAQLPVGMIESEFFVRFVSIFQQVGESLLADADNVDNVVDLSVAPEELVRWLGSWIGVESIDASLPDELQRRIVRSAAQTLAWRGTTGGLRRYLELASGGRVDIEEGGGVWRYGDAPDDTAWVRMCVDSTGWMPLADFVELVRDEVPAHVRAELFVAGRLVWTSETGVTHE